jgi:hypothetical protein
METADAERERLWTEHGEVTRAWQDAVRDRDWAKAAEAAVRAYAIGQAIMALDAETGAAMLRRAC